MGTLVIIAVLLVIVGAVAVAAALILMLRKSSRTQLQQSAQLCPGKMIEAPTAGRSGIPRRRGCSGESGRGHTRCTTQPAPISR